ncbi:MAG: hypothetical protein F6K36_03505 [Symploca sp. SIO3C6]|uniref:Tetratricopeptide repeat protein n=1 Tax=Symploca sp. SIO1C4 TaxID=2607765 RepID=A0A6B3NF20_9CYAN|nr:hypothetical protein [Symploca sp. SIO3C6]NER27778.1 hypothetical protein [Symploca sp. SIO1C4]NET05251.1 hypothetical protein [Symploca sp. SIO2B6]
MSESAASLFDTGMERYQAGEGPDTLIPVFQEVCQLSPKTSAAWSCLAWLYLLEDKPNKAYKAALKGVKLNQKSPQAQVNLAIAMLETGKTGVRKHIEIVKQQMTMSAELEKELSESLEDGLRRKPDWQSLNRVKKWLYEA